MSTWCGAMLEYYLGEGEDVWGSAQLRLDGGGWTRQRTAAERTRRAAQCPPPHTLARVTITLCPPPTPHQQQCPPASAGAVTELETKVHPKVRNHGEGLGPSPS